MNFLRLSFFFVLVAISLMPVNAQEWVSYQSQQQINDLVDTGDELLMATDAGLVVLNKATLEKTIFNKANSNLSNNHIQTITQAPNGDFWIGTYDVVMGRFDGTDFYDTTIPDSDEYDQNTKLYDLKIAPNGDFWLGTSEGVFHREGQVWSHYDEDEFGPDFFEAWDIEINNDGEVFVASIDVYQLADGEWSNITEDTDLEGYLGADLFISSAGDLHFAGDLEKTGRFDGQQWQEYAINFNGSEVIKFTEDVVGDIYFSSKRDGIFKLLDDAWVLQADAQTAAFDNHISYFYIDEDNNRWLNNNIQLSVDKDGDLQSTLISQHTITVNNVSNIHKGDNGHVYFFAGQKISVLDPNGSWSFLSALPTENFNDILFLADNDIWLASNSGLHHYDGAEWTFYELEVCKSFAVDAQGGIYVRASDRIYIIDNGEITEYNVGNSPLSTLIISGHGVDANDNLWIASFSWEGDNTIQRVSSEGIWTTYSGSEHPVLNKRPVGDFHADNNGNIWVAADQVGVIKFDGQNFTNPIQENISNLGNYNAFSIESDSEGRMYFAHQYGITTLLDGAWEELLIDEVPNANTSFGANIKFDDAGTLWWASSRHGVFSYTPAPVTSVFEAFEISTGFLTYPNPADHYTVLDFTIKESAKVNIVIYSSIGQLVKSLDLGQLPEGACQQTIDVSAFPKGFYSIQLQINSQSFTKTMIVQ